MRVRLLFLALMIIVVTSPRAQSVRIIRVKAGDDVAQAYSSNGFYRFPRFEKATLYYKNGSINEGSQFNYSMLSGNFHFIGPQGDTVELGGKTDIDSINVGGTMFVANDGFLEVINTVDSVALLKKTTIKTQTENVGAYGMANSTASITNIRSYVAGTGVYNLILNQDIVVTETVSWYFADKNNNPVKATKANLLKLLPAQKQAKTEDWLKQNKTSFEKEADLKKLMLAIAG